MERRRSFLHPLPCAVLLLGLTLPVVGANAAAPASAAAGGAGAEGVPEVASERGATSYSPIAIEEDFATVRERLVGEKAEVMERHQALLEERYDLDDRPADATMSRGKPLQEGPRARLADGVSWERLGRMTPEEIREQGVFPRGFMPLPHPKQVQGGMVFPQFLIDRMREQDGRDLQRFDVDFDIPDHFLPEFPPAIYLVSRPDLGDVSQGQVVSIDNFHELFNGIINPKQLEGLRLLVSEFPQQQFNATEDRRSDRPSAGVTCFDCHTNGHTNGATHLVGEPRPQEFRRRLDTPTLRGVNIQRLFGSQRALKTVEDFTEFEQRGAYFDGDTVTAAKKGVNVLERGSQVHMMGEFQAMLDFPPAPKLDLFGRLDHSKATEQEIRGEELFFSKARCHECHVPPFYTDNTMHDLQVERFFEPQLINGRMATKEGPTKTFPLRGIKDSPPYLHDGRLLTLADAVEFFNLVLGVQLTEQEKKDIVAFLRVL